jgi:hypothetical protein
MRDPHDTQAQEALDQAEQVRAELKRKQQVEDIKWLMTHAAGRRFIGRLLAFTGTRRTSFHNSGSVMAFNEGQRNVGLMIESELLEHIPDGYLKLLKDYRNE